jgi:hypothetical protein
VVSDRRRSGLLDVFGEKFPVPPETIYKYVRATVDVERQCLGVYLDDRLVDEHPYSLRRGRSGGPMGSLRGPAVLPRVSMVHDVLALEK